MELTMLHLGDCREVVRTIQAGSVDAIVTDPPYGLVEPRSSKGFMGKAWDAGVPGVEYWQAFLPTIRPGGYLLAFGGTRTYHRLACAIEDAGLELRDCLMWVYGTGFPKSKSCLKPAWEPILLARKPGKGTVPLGIDGCRIPAEERPLIVRDTSKGYTGNTFNGAVDGSLCGSKRGGTTTEGRYPANLLHDDSEEVTELLGEQARFFYSPKASKADRGPGNTHPTVKPLAVMRWLVKLVSPPGGTVLDPFAGSGSTLIAAEQEGREAIGIELDPAYHAIATNRLAA